MKGSLGEPWGEVGGNNDLNCEESGAKGCYNEGSVLVLYQVGL